MAEALLTANALCLDPNRNLNCKGKHPLPTRQSRPQRLNSAQHHWQDCIVHLADLAGKEGAVGACISPANAEQQWAEHGMLISSLHDQCFVCDELIYQHISHAVLAHLIDPANAEQQWAEHGMLTQWFVWSMLCVWWADIPTQLACSIGPLDWSDNDTIVY